MDPGNAEKVEYQELLEFTDNFSEQNFVGTFQFGKVYRGVAAQYWRSTDDVMVKIWEIPEKHASSHGASLARVMHEFILLQHERLMEHPGMIEFIGFCSENGHVAAVYSFSPLDTVHNLVPRDSFTWLQRIKVALGFAQVLKLLHAGNSVYSGFLVRNISAAHIVVDKEYNPKLYDFGMISGGIFPHKMMYECNGCYGYVDPNIAHSGEWSKKTDVFAFGVVLLNLITKRVDVEEEKRPNAPPLYSWAWSLSKSCESGNDSRKSTLSVVDQSLTTDPNFSSMDGLEITDLAMKCINRNADERPTMKQVVKYLLKLQVTKKHAEFLGLAAPCQ